MTSLTCDQKNACRNNPLAAYVAKRLPTLLAAVVVLNLSNLVFVGLAVVYGINPHLLPTAAVAHQIAIVLSALSVASGIVLAYELGWMRQHQISPDSFDGSRFTPPEEATVWPSLPKARAIWYGTPNEDSHLARRLQEAERQQVVDAMFNNTLDPRAAVNWLRTQGADYGRRHAQAHGSIEKDYLRSMEIHHLALADILDSGMRSLEEKKEIGAVGSNSGFRQMDMTRETFQRITRIATAATRTLWSKRKHSEKKNLPKRDCRP